MKPKDTDVSGETTSTPAVVPALGGEASLEDLHAEVEPSAAPTPVSVDESAAKTEVRLLAPQGYRCN
jgi:hypothetical protein